MLTTFEREHRCKAMESCPQIYIQTLNSGAGWYWHFIKNQDTPREKTHVHQIRACPYCAAHLDEPLPLKPDQLRNMIGKPVFIQLYGPYTPGYWSVVKGITDNAIRFENGIYEKFSRLYDTWTPFDREPRRNV